MKTVLVTGGAGFIGSHLVDKLIADDWHVTVVDNFDASYDPAAKRNNIGVHLFHPRFSLVETDLCDRKALRQKLAGKYDAIVHLAAKVGGHTSVLHPSLYVDVNVGGTLNLLELAREWGVKHFVFASSGSVYGANHRVPWTEEDTALAPVSPYASTKVAGEALGRAYSHLYGIRFLSLRLFSVYGPRQRPDCAMCTVARKLLGGLVTPVFGHGAALRDYTFIDDIVNGIAAALAYEQSPYEVFNLGSACPISLQGMVDALAHSLGVEPDVRVNFLPDLLGNVPTTHACIEKAQRLLHYQPRTCFREGIEKFALWMYSQPNLWLTPEAEMVGMFA